MDSISLSTLITLITQSAAGEAGKSAWEGLIALTRRAFGHEQRAEAALQAAKAGGPAGALDLAGHLMQRATDDPELMRFLRTWMTEAKRFTATDGVTVNTISGDAHLRDAVQARDVGTIHLGGP